MIDVRPVDAGYFPKAVLLRPEYARTPPISEVLSVSLCMSAGPPGWMASWRHNALGWFNSIGEARASAASEPERFRLFAYRLAPVAFRGGEPVQYSLPPDVRPEAIPVSFVSRGFDAVSRSREDVLGFECSPLSCNGLAAELPANDACLFPSLEAAVAGAIRFSREQPEPGDYFVVEVLEAARG